MVNTSWKFHSFRIHCCFKIIIFHCRSYIKSFACLNHCEFQSRSDEERLQTCLTLINWNLTRGRPIYVFVKYRLSNMQCQNFINNFTVNVEHLSLHTFPDAILNWTSPINLVEKGQKQMNSMMTLFNKIDPYNPSLEVDDIRKIIDVSV